MDDEELVKDQVRRVLVGLESRVQAMVVYGIMGIGIGLLMIFTGGPAAVEEHYGPWTRVILGVPALVAGVLFAAGAAGHSTSPRAWRTSLVGSSLFCAWATTMAVTYVIAASQDGMHFVDFGETLDRVSARPYAAVLFEGLSILLLLHTVTLLRLGKPRRRADTVE